MKVGVMGAGSIGGYFGGMLARGGHDVTFIARGDNLDAIRRDGLRMQTQAGDFTVPCGATDRPELKPIEAAEPGSRPTPYRRSPVYFAGAFCATPHYDRAGLRTGHTFGGPAIVTEASSTTVVPPGARLTVDPYGFMIVDTDGGAHAG